MDTVDRASAKHRAWGAAAALGLAAAGIAWRDCLLIAASAVLLQRLSVARLDAGGPWEGWRAALRCIEAGVAGLALAAALAAIAALALMGFWQPEHPYPLLAAVMMLSAGLVSSLLDPERPALGREALRWAAIAAMVLLVTWLEGRGLPAAPCVFVVLVAVLLARSSWHLAHATAGGLLQGDRRRQ